MKHLTVWSPNLAPQSLLDSPHALPAHHKTRTFFDALDKSTWLELPRLDHDVVVTQLRRVHDAKYVDDCLAGDVYHPIQVEQALWACRVHLRATYEALAQKAIVCAPVSGFHHAGYAGSWGFCTFNGLAVSLVALDAFGNKKPPLILDCDAHYGDGTDEILQAKFHGKNVGHFTMTMGLRDPEAFFRVLGQHCHDIRQGRHGIVFFQAGMDAWVEDPFHAGFLTAEQLKRRDRMVFDACVASDTPCVWNFAGGYAKRRTVILHMETYLQATHAVMSKSLTEDLRGTIEQAGQGQPGGQGVATGEAAATQAATHAGPGLDAL